MNSPLVSVIIAVFNGSEFISKSLNSIKSQTFVNWECIIVDDGSEDNTCSIIEKIIINDNRFKLLKTKGRYGPYVCANYGISLSKGNYIARLDADDYSSPDRLQVQYDALTKNKRFKLCVSDHYNVFENKLIYKKIYSDISVLKYYLIFKNPVLHSSFFFDKEWYYSIGRYPNLKFAQDYFLVCKATLMDVLIVINKPLSYWTFHNSSITKKFNLLQTREALEVNNWYLRCLFPVSIPFNLSLLTFGAYRSVKIPVFYTFLESLKFLTFLENVYFSNKNYSKVKFKIYYDIFSIYCSSLNDCLISLYYSKLIFNFSFIFSFYFVKLLFIKPIRNVFRRFKKIWF